MPNVAQNLNTNGVVVVEPVALRPGETFEDLRKAMNIFSQTLKRHTIARGFLGSFVVLDNAEPVSEADDSPRPDDVILLSFFWKSQQAVDAAAENPLYQVLLDDLLSHCLSTEGHSLRAPGLVTERFELDQLSGLSQQPTHGPTSEPHRGELVMLQSHSIH